MNDTYDSSLEARLGDIERKIDRLKDSLLPIKMWLGFVSIILGRNYSFQLDSFLQGTVTRPGAAPLRPLSSKGAEHRARNLCGRGAANYQLGASGSWRETPTRPHNRGEYDAQLLDFDAEFCSPVESHEAIVNALYITISAGDAICDYFWAGACVSSGHYPRPRSDSSGWPA